MRDARGLTCDHIYRWKLLLEEYAVNIVYIKGVDIIVADAIIWLNYDKKINTRIINAVQVQVLTRQFFLHHEIHQ